MTRISFWLSDFNRVLGKLTSLELLIEKLAINPMLRQGMLDIIKEVDKQLKKGKKV